MHVLGALEDLRGRRPKGSFQKPAIGDTFLQRVGYGAWLLMNLLQHEMAVQALLSRIRTQRAFANLALNAVAFPIDDANRRTANLRDVTLLKKHKTACHRQQRRDV